MRILTFVLCLLCFSVSAQIDWDFPYNPDSDNDGYIYSEDLLDLLAVYGQEYSSDELYLSQDNSSLIVYVGDMTRMECGATCLNLEGSWGNLNEVDIAKHYFDLTLETYDSQDIQNHTFLWYQKVQPNAGYNANPIAWEMVLRIRNGTTSSNGEDQFPPFTNLLLGANDSQEHECWCVTHQRPKVEYMHIQNLTEEEVNVLSSQGWRHTNVNFGSNSDNMYTGTMWRWAE